MKFRRLQRIELRLSNHQASLLNNSNEQFYIELYIIGITTVNSADFKSDHRFILYSQGNIGLL